MNKNKQSETGYQKMQTKKPTRKKKLLVFVILAGSSAFGTLAYLNKNPDPTTWKSIRTDYKNTK